ncbi:MAG: LuxR C-terminal-related transcriptional regulator [Bacteroidales bacterium]
MDFGAFNRQVDSHLGEPDYDVRPEDYRALEGKLELIRHMAEVQNSTVIVYDFFKQDYLFRRIHFSGQLGHDGEQAAEEGLAYFVSLVHPDDFPVLMDTYVKAFAFLGDLPVSEKKDYKLIYTFRSKDREGNYHPLVDQVVVMETDRKGNIWLILGISDLLPPQEAAGATRQFIRLKDKSLFLFNDRKEYEGKPVLSSREIEVLGLVSRGFASKSIAERLFISVNTVNNHRQAILRKINAANTAEAVAYARSLGFV